MKTKYKIEFNNHKKEDFIDVWNNDIHIFVRDIETNHIVGEITILPLSYEQFKDFLMNKFDDTKLDGKKLLVYNDNNSYYLLFSAIAIDLN